MNNPTPKPDDLKLVIKLMKMTNSTVDNEALMALRKANEKIKALGWDWETLLESKVTIVEDPFGKIKEVIKTQSSTIKPQAPSRPQAQQTSQQQQTQSQAHYNTYKTPPKPSATAQWQAQQAAAQKAAQNYQKATQPRPPRPLVNSIVPNKKDDNCFVCGEFVNAWKGTRFVPKSFNSNATSAIECICDKCNQSATIKVPERRAKRKGLDLSSILG